MQSAKQGPEITRRARVKRARVELNWQGQAVTVTSKAKSPF
jgi:hypothetical protein